MFLLDQDILQAIADHFKCAGGVADLPTPYWSNIVVRTHLPAYNSIFQRLLGRGFTIAQITAWDQGGEYERHIALYFALLEGQALNEYDKGLDRRNEMDKMTTLQIGGVWQSPLNASIGPGMVSTGAIDTSADLFVPFDPNDPNPPGQPTHF